ncbi:YceD family protein [Viscerimonas tarda]
MGKFSLYNIPLKGISEGNREFKYLLDDQFFNLISDADSDLHKGSVEVVLTIKHKTNLFEFLFKLAGEVQVTCDRCLDYMPIEIETNNRLIVKFGQEYSEESDEIVVIPEDDGEINIAWFLYEFVSLNIPMKHVHPQGKCNKLMSSKLNKHKVTSPDDDDLDLDDDIQDDNPAESGSQWDSIKDLSFD